MIDSRNLDTEINVYEYIKQSINIHNADDAIIFYKKHISYKLFLNMIDKFASALIGMGINEGDVVTVSLPNIPQNAVSFYAIAKCNAVSNIIHPLTPLNAIENDMKAMNSKLLITTKAKLAMEGIESDIKVIYCDISYFMGVSYKLIYKLSETINFKQKINYYCFENLIDNYYSESPLPTKHGICCILHSGGTTGKPKNVKISHGALNRLAARKQYYLLDENLRNKVLYSVLPTFHGFGLCMNLHMSVCYGMTQLMVAKFRAKQAVKWIKKYKVSFINGVPTIFYALIKTKGFNPKSAKSINRCFVGGDNVSSELIKRFNKAVTGDCDDMKLFEGYGLTETIAVCAVNTPEHFRIGTSGKAIPGIMIEAMKDNIILPCGQEGELCVCGDTLMDGYIDNQTNPIVESEGKLWLHTGDLGYVDESGYIHFKQRIKNIILRKGVNIYPSEVEDVIMQLDYVKQCCVVGKYIDDEQTQVVYAYIKLFDKQLRTDVTAQNIQNYCKKHLIRYAVPEKIVFTANFPRTIIGKIDINYFQNRND